MSGIDIVVEIAGDALYTILMVALPVLLVSLVVGLVVSVFQTVTSIQEQTLTFVPKILAVFLTLIMTGAWMLETIVEFTENLWSNFSYFLDLF